MRDGHTCWEKDQIPKDLSAQCIMACEHGQLTCYPLNGRSNRGRVRWKVCILGCHYWQSWNDRNLNWWDICLKNLQSRSSLCGGCTLEWFECRNWKYLYYSNNRVAFLLEAHYNACELHSITVCMDLSLITVLEHNSPLEIPLTLLFMEDLKDALDDANWMLSTIPIYWIYY